MTSVATISLAARRRAMAAGRGAWATLCGEGQCARGAVSLRQQGLPSEALRTSSIIAPGHHSSVAIDAASQFQQQRGFRSSIQMLRGAQRYTAANKKKKKWRHNRRDRYRRNEQPKPFETYKHRTHGELGRPIMTKERATTLSDASVHGLPSFATDMPWEQAKSLVHNAQGKMMFRMKFEHAAEGPGHDRQFYTTLRATLDPDTPGVGMGGDDVKFVCTGAARSKRQSEHLAAVDLVAHLAESIGVDLRKPPDVRQAKKARVEEVFKAKVQRAQMLLELLNVSRPKFETVPKVFGAGFESEVRFYCRGVPIRASAEGRSKAEAEGRALLAVIASEGTLEGFVGRRKMDQLQGLIDRSPAGHVAALRVQPLPEEVLDGLAEVMGSPAKHDERMKRHAQHKARYEREFHERRMKKNARGGGGFEALAGRNGGAEESDDINEAFAKEELAREEKAAADPEGKQGTMKKVRDALPIKAIQQDLIEALKSQQVVVVSGGTGSGKSTQCPNYILEDAIANGRGADTRIVVTQPRRIAAISVAERVADERDETVGKSVGYTVRFNRQAPRENGSIEFVTTGVLLRRLVNDPSLSGVSHVMIDEVHERDIDTDFLLVLLRDLLSRRPELRVILMSATLDAESFGKYFSSSDDSSPARQVPVMSVPTKPRHPVECFHLEDISGEEQISGAELPQSLQDAASSLLRLHDQQLQLELEEAIAEEGAASRLEARAIREDEGSFSSDSDSSDSGSDSDSDGEVDSEYGYDSAGTFQSPSARRVATLRHAVSMRGATESKNAARQTPMPKEREIHDMTTNLAANIAQHVAQVETDAGRKGSVLCFLPGLDEIKAATELLEEEADPELRAKMDIICLHSTIPQDEQQKVFIPAKDGTIKVILATNIAESSVTIDDVLAVVDGGLVRELNWDADKAMSEMVTVPTSKTSATQRLGRAGRVAPGQCYRLYSRGMHAAMPERPLPEIQRTALEATCLNTCSMTNDSVETFLGRAMDPPKKEAVVSSLDRLQKLGAITMDRTKRTESLTPLGNCLSRLPLDPAVGKMLVMACLMQCLDPVLTAAACLSSREVFYTPPGMRKEQRKAREAFSRNSDMATSVLAYDIYQDILREEGWAGARPWAADRFVSMAALSSINSVRSQLLSELNRIGLVPNSDLEGRGRRRQLRQRASVNRNADSELLCTALWSCGLPDNLASRRQLGHFGTLRTRTEQHAGLHPSSVLFHRKPPTDIPTHKLPQLFFYREMVLSSQVFLRGCTALSPEQILLFGGYALESKEATSKESGTSNSSGNELKVIDDWIVADSSCVDTLDLLACARREMAAALDLKVMDPRRPLPQMQQEIIDGVCYVFDVLGGGGGNDQSEW